jgi:hypothetical protein
MFPIRPLMAAAGMLLFSSVCWANPAPPVGDAAVNGVPALIEQLDAPEFAERQAASQKLSEVGAGIFPDLEKAAGSGSREKAGRALDILKRHFERGDDESRKAAKASLERLAESGEGGIAQRAGEILNPPQIAQTLPPGIFGGAAPIRAANIQIQIGARNNARRIHVRNVNGKREVELEENGKKTKVQDGTNGGIEAEITETVNGKETTRKIEAKDLDDLKKKDADAARIFEQFGARPLGGQIQIGAAPRRRNDAIDRSIKGLDEHIGRLKVQGAGDAATKRQIETLERHKNLLERMRQPEDEK